MSVLAGLAAVLLTIPTVVAAQVRLTEWNPIASALRDRARPSSTIVTGLVESVEYVVRPEKMSGRLIDRGNGYFQFELPRLAEAIVGRLFKVNVTAVHVPRLPVAAGSTLDVFLSGSTASHSFFVTDLVPGESYLLCLVPLLAEGLRYPELTALGDLHGLAVGPLEEDPSRAFSPENSWSLLGMADAAIRITDGTQATVDAVIAEVEVVPPTAAVTAPLEGDHVAAGLTLRVSAADNVGVTRVEASLDNQSLGEMTLTETGYESALSDNLTEGAHSVAAVAFDRAGNEGHAEPVRFFVDRTAPACR